MDELTSIAAGVAICVGVLTWSIRIGAVAGVLTYLALLALIINR
jgi:hypothetical protein